MDDYGTPATSFATLSGLALEATVDGGRLTSDGGLAWLAEADAELGVCERLAEHVPEWRSERVRHALVDLVRQRVYQIACGYEDQNDADALRCDALLTLMCGRLPETAPDLASQPTLSRRENAPTARACYRMAVALAQRSIAQRSKDGAPQTILLDVDATDDPTHGDQEGTSYHGYYAQHMYHRLRIFDGDTGHLITAILRPGNTHASHGVVSILTRVVGWLRQAWPEVNIALRADAGFASPAVYEYCEAESIAYTVGLITNARLEAMAAPVLAQAQQQDAVEQQKVRLLADGPYQAGSWERERRVVYKAEVLAEGTNTRFVVTTRPAEPTHLYAWYVQRGASENWIKDFKLARKGDRLSCHRFWANQFRLFLHAAAYWLLDTLRRKLVAAGVVRMQLDSLRLRLIKIGGRVKALGTNVKLQLAASHPGQYLWQTLMTSQACS